MHTFTIENPKTGNHRTFRLEEQPEDAKFAPRSTVVKLLCGRSNSEDYRGFAFLREEGRIAVWKSKRGENGASDYERFARLIERALAGENDTISVLDAIPCRRCGELLTVPKSIRDGIGPVCAKK